MRPFRFLALVIPPLAGGCSKAPDIYAPPIERRPIQGVTPDLEEFIEMKSPSVGSHLAGGFLSAPAGQVYRWTGQQPTLRFHLRRTNDRRVRFEFVIAEATLKDTGPVAITFKVNGRVLDTVTYNSHGDKSFEKSVRPEWLAADPVVVSAEIDKVWISKTDGARLGVMLIRAGFVP